MFTGELSGPVSICTTLLSTASLLPLLMDHSGGGDGAPYSKDGMRPELSCVPFSLCLSQRVSVSLSFVRRVYLAPLMEHSGGGDRASPLEQRNATFNPARPS